MKPIFSTSPGGTATIRKHPRSTRLRRQRHSKPPIQTPLAAACRAGSPRSRASIPRTRTSLRRRRRTTNRNKPICEHSMQGSQLRAISGTRWRFTWLAKLAAARSSRCENPCRGASTPPGQSPAYLHHRKNFEARAGKPAAGFFESDGARMSRSLSFFPCQLIVLGTRQGGLPSEPSSARTRERAGMRRGEGPRPPAAPASGDPSSGSRLEG
jgi:hypothetical protein